MVLYKQAQALTFKASSIAVSNFTESLPSDLCRNLFVNRSSDDLATWKFIWSNGTLSSYLTSLILWAAEFILSYLLFITTFSFQNIIWPNTSQVQIIIENCAASWENKHNGMFTQWRMACASAQSDQSLRCLHEENLGP